MPETKNAAARQPPGSWIGWGGYQLKNPAFTGSAAGFWLVLRGNNSS
jgi:hypothetical protein